MSIDIEIFQQDGQYVQVSPPGTVAQMHGWPSPWLLVLTSIMVGVMTGILTAWMLSRAGWQLTRTSGTTTPIPRPHTGQGSADE
ncbi:hypothetical protein AW168_33250 [Nocardia brasiliensis]|uniref:Transmembrane protein n=1 Tax=Nocardia brasiliensis (strain ATCC 700358 / HUJEG-1) TaxID=1133849 RepID=K0ET25_NOCB7|nr:hypothetical protein O3I_025035 [Nocardia brasiliensis ATCC 700358]OCF86030.1 hypothetical protein AW168_33250 [Nocardia brasiliensis]